MSERSMKENMQAFAVKKAWIGYNKLDRKHLAMI